MAVTGKLEITIKISEFPAEAETVENGWRSFKVDCNGKMVAITVKPKMFRKLEEAQANYPQWIAAIAGKMGPETADGFVLTEANIQTFEKKQKEQPQDS